MNDYINTFVEENGIKDPEAIELLKNFFEFVYDDIYDEGYNDGYGEGMEEGEKNA